MDPIGSSNNSSPPPVRQWVETFGHHLCAMALTVGLPVEEISLLAGGILTNLTAPAPGVGGHSHGAISGGVNLVALADPDHRSHRLADHLFRPVFAVQEYLRHAAQRTSRMWGDLHRFGPANLKDWQEILKMRPNEIIHSRVVDLLDATTKDLKWGDGLPRGWDSPENPWSDIDGKNPELTLRERLPGFRQNPSFVLRPGELTDLADMMKDVADQHAFIVDSEGRLLHNSGTEGNGKWNAAMRHLAQLMGGKDVPMVRLHPDQGHGQLTSARAALFSAMSAEQVSELLGGESVSPGRLVLEETILWTPTWQPVRALRDGCASRFWAGYKGIIEELLNARASRTATILENNAVVWRQIELLEVEVIAALDAYKPALRRYLRPFGGLVGKLFWALRLFKLSGDLLPNAVKATVMHALKSHVAAVESALSQVEVQRAAGFARRIEAVLREKGPCTARDLQRSIFQSKRADIEDGLERLLGAGRVAYAQNRREYHIPSETEADGSCTATIRPLSPNTAHG